MTHAISIKVSDIQTSGNSIVCYFPKMMCCIHTFKTIYYHAKCFDPSQIATI